MRVENLPGLFHAGTAGQAAPAAQVVSMLNGRAGEGSPLEAARRALLDAKERLEQHRDEELEQAMDGYRALRARQTSYETGLNVQQGYLQDFQSLSGRYDALSEELAAARADCGDETGALPQDLRPALRVSALEDQLAEVDRGLSALVDQANRYASGQRQYAAYLDKTGQGGYAAAEYQGQPAYTREGFAAQAADLMDRMAAGADQWRERVSAYCGQYGRTPYDFECYLQERRQLTDAVLTAQQRLSELLHAVKDTADGLADAAAAPPAKGSFDTVELSGDGADAPKA